MSEQSVSDTLDRTCFTIMNVKKKLLHNFEYTEYNAMNNSCMIPRATKMVSKH